MKLPKDVTEKIIEALTSSIADLQGIYLYGSAAQDDMRADSDIDIAVLVAVPVVTTRLWELSQKLSVMVGRDVDLVDLRSIPTVLRFQIVSKGRRIFSLFTDECERFEDYSWSDYVRFNEERAGILADIQERGSVYG